MHEPAALAMEIIIAETRGIPFAEAARRFEFPRIGRVHFGVEDLLQCRVPAPFQASIRALVRRAANGELDALRHSWFVGAAQGTSFESALLRFGLYQAARINLLIETWSAPEFEASGALDAIDLEAQQVLYELLALRCDEHEGVRPLHLYVTELVVFASAYLNRVQAEAQQSPAARTRLAHITEAISLVRDLSAADAALLRRSSLEDEVGDQRLMDRYGEHFESVNAVRVRRSRLLKSLGRGAPPVDDSNARLIDIVLGAAATFRSD